MLDFDNEDILKKLKVKECPYCGGKIKKIRHYKEEGIIFLNKYKCINCKHKFNVIG